MRALAELAWVDGWPSFRPARQPSRRHHYSQVCSHSRAWRHRRTCYWRTHSRLEDKRVIGVTAMASHNVTFLMSSVASVHAGAATWVPLSPRRPPFFFFLFLSFFFFF